MSLSFEPAALSSPSIDTLRVQKLFSLPARLADSAFLRREIADRMHERLSMIRVEPRRVLDAGCGEGADLPLLQDRFPQADMLALDASRAMLLQAGKTGRKKAEAICADFAALPFGSGAINLLWSNLALHWHPEPGMVLSEWRRALSRDGALMFSCFGPETLSLVREAFRLADAYEHVLPFMEMHDLGDRMVEAGFPSPVLDREMLMVTYQAPEKLLADVRAFGGNPLERRRRSLMGKAAFGRVREFLENEKDADGKISLSFEIIYGHAFCSVQSEERQNEHLLHFRPRL